MRKLPARPHSSERNVAPHSPQRRPASLQEISSDRKSPRRSRKHSSPPLPPASTLAASASVSASSCRSAHRPHTDNQRPSPMAQTIPSHRRSVHLPPAEPRLSSPAAA